MSGPIDDMGTRSDTSRVIAFSDAVLAIIITLLVIDLRVPDVPPGRLLSGLLEQWPGYVAYLASYAYVAVVWLNHKGSFNRVKESDRGLHWVNLFVLFTTALLPFPTAVVSDALQEHDQQDQRVAVAFYALIGALLCASWLAFFHYLARRNDLLKDEVSERHFPAERVRALVGVILYVVAGLIGYLVAPLASLVIFVVLPVFYAVTSAGLYQVPLTRRIAPRPPGT
ncbi:TMEM175 family protein [Solwaraspora sp. WMMD1047]|uniref:TMEM175 family protein n=1 Tax=Solwaraspora sp. WMMD1047 TaxID=3016102 RepID=UPI002417C527|nr:TMEM175 family protein [Solwaraspora sp. WMMD1047]MDG4829955.1 TMEM175 family protein [Solwaraspora sp. WMMD1047]